MNRLIAVVSGLWLAASAGGAWGQNPPGQGPGVPSVPPGFPLAGTFSGSLLSNGQYLILNNVAGVGVLTVDNLNNSGFPAYTSMGADTSYPSTAFISSGQLSGHYEHMAVGYGKNLVLNGVFGVDFIEASRYDTASNSTIPPTQFAIQQTGGVAKTPILINAGLTQGSTTAVINTCVGCGGVWPANGSYLTLTTGAGGIFISPGTFISSGGGTSTATLSSPALLTNGFVPVTVGVPTYDQYSSVIFSEQGPISFYSWANGGGSNPLSPYFLLDRQYGRVGMNLGTGALPVNDIDIVGKITVGPDTNHVNRGTFASDYDINIADSGTNFLQFFKESVNRFAFQWNATPSRIDMLERNGSTIPLSLYLDGTAAVHVGGQLVIAGQLNVTSMTQTAVAQSGTLCYNSGTGVVTYDATLGCLASTIEAKNDWLDMVPEQALAIVMQLRPGSYTYKLGLGLPEGPQVGFAAEQIAQIDDRLVGYRPDGTLGGVRYQQASALYAGAIAALESRLEALEARMH